METLHLRDETSAFQHQTALAWSLLPPSEQVFVKTVYSSPTTAIVEMSAPQPDERKSNSDVSLSLTAFVLTPGSRART